MFNVVSNRRQCGRRAFAKCVYLYSAGAVTQIEGADAAPASTRLAITKRTRRNGFVFVLLN